MAVYMPRQLVRPAGARRRCDRVAEIEQHRSEIVGPARFAEACRTLQELVDALTGINTDA